MPDAVEPSLPFPVDELERIDAPDVSTFTRRYLRASRPVVITGLTADWSPAADWTPPRMAARYGDAQVLAARLTNGTLMDDAARATIFHHMPLREFVESLNGPTPATDYVMAPTWNLPERFQADYRVPSYCIGARHLRAKVWFGKRGTVTPFHRDVPHNLNVHLVGRKRWLLVSPGQTSRMYSRGLRSNMPNFSEVDPEHPDYARHPKFRGTTVLAATVGPGETLLIPHGWWHHTRSLDDAVAMNFWWGGRLVQMASIASTVFKQLRGIRQNEWS